MAWELEERIAMSESREVRGRAPLIQHSSKRSWEPVSEVCVVVTLSTRQPSGQEARLPRERGVCVRRGVDPTCTFRSAASTVSGT